MSRLRKPLAAAVTFVAAMTIAAAAVGVGVGAIGLAVFGVEAATSRDGLSQILGPFFVAEGVIYLALAVGGLTAAWVAIKSRGAHHLLAIVAGTLTVLGALLLYAQAPPVDWALPAFSLAVALYGLGFAVGGCMLSVAVRYLPPSRAGLAAALGLGGVVIAFPISAGAMFAGFVAAETQWEVPPGVRTRLHREAYRSWDSPVQRLLYLEVAVNGTFETQQCGKGYRLEALTAFGLHVDSIEVDGCGTTSH